MLFRKVDKFLTNYTISYERRAQNKQAASAWKQSGEERATVTSATFYKAYEKLIPVAARSEAWTVFPRSNPGIVGSNHTQGMDVCIVCIYSVFVLFCV
jgi:hypothetical protein